jgi:hypothetical protein
MTISHFAHLVIGHMAEIDIVPEYSAAPPLVLHAGCIILVAGVTTQAIHLSSPPRPKGRRDVGFESGTCPEQSRRIAALKSHLPSFFEREKATAEQG